MGLSSRVFKGESKVLKKLIKPWEEVERVNAELEKKEKDFAFIKAGCREERLNFILVSVWFQHQNKGAYWRQPNNYNKM